MKALRYILSIVIIAFIFGGCAYNFIVEEQVIDPSDPDAPELSFSTDIVPIFTAKCTTCHTSGGQLPDLSADNAYNSINTSRYINSDSPESSLIYTRPNPENTDSHAKYSVGEANNVLIWITQGAKNN